ncbi:AAA family ATPase [Massilia cavernae]|uniref:Nicotinamide-nucleotide adenylyltransferase n=1 Tax=Massilia cavernae TaxID=2320864 RepID=A0A418XSQ0_9BURK|nr:ATP-binding protein [Massilia cavernae]RJG15537.1 nicotinamide-nucleotide adenylyltransferase [Massilia cavernae]
MSGVLRVALLGAESSGKSTLAAALATHFDTVWVPEYLREFVDTKGRVPVEHEQLGIARTQMEREYAAAAVANRFLFCDTTPLMTAIYSRHYWGRLDEELAELELVHDYAFTLVTAPDSPWTPDGLQRESDEVRQRVHGEVMRVLDERAIPFMVVTGSLPERVMQVDRLLKVARG